MLDSEKSPKFFKLRFHTPYPSLFERWKWRQGACEPFI